MNPLHATLGALHERQHAELASLPRGLDPWVVSWIRRTEEENRFLAENGAIEQAIARGRVLVTLIEAATAYLDTCLTASQAAAERGCHEETVKRLVRAGAVPDRRQAAGGHHRVRRGDMRALDGGYDPSADAARVVARRHRRRSGVELSGE